MGKLTATGLRNLKEPGRYADGDGLMLRLVGPGKGSWIVRVQANGRRQDGGVGTLASMTLAEARDAARDVRKQIKAGIDIIYERKKERMQIPNFRTAAAMVHGEHKVAWKNRKHAAQWINTLELYAFPKLGTSAMCWPLSG